jgi:hypothetical protein
LGALCVGIAQRAMSSSVSEEAASNVSIVFSVGQWEALCDRMDPGDIEMLEIVVNDQDVVATTSGENWGVLYSRCLRYLMREPVGDGSEQVRMLLRKMRSETEAASQDIRTAVAVREVRIEAGKMAVQGLNGKIRIAGKIVDDDGNELDGVHVNATVAKLTSAWEDADLSTVVNESVSKRFDVSASGEVLSIVFEKDGYYSAIVSASRIREHVQADDKLNRTADVVLVRKGDIVELQEVLLIFRLTAENPGAYANIDVSKIVSGAPVRLIRPPSVGFGSGSRIEDVPGVVGVSVRVPLNQGGGDGLDLQNIDRASRGRVPGELVLQCMKEDSGIILCHDDSNGPLAADVNWRQMRVAPDAGYDSERRFSAADLMRGEHLFYVKLGSLYGKGKLRSVIQYHNAQRVDVVLYLFLQSDGSRNVAGDP